MAFTVNELKRIKVSAVHDPALYVTYYVDDQPYCLRPLTDKGRDEVYCANRAGYGASHGYVEGPCKFHGGNGFQAISTGRYSKVLRRELKVRYQEYASDPSMLNISSELILLRTLMAEYLAIYQETHAIKALELTTRTLIDITGVVERIELIQSSQVLTITMTKLLMARAVDVAKRFLDGDDLIRFIDAWEADVKGYLETPPETPVLELPAGRIRIDG